MRNSIKLCNKRKNIPSIKINNEITLTGHSLNLITKQQTEVQLSNTLILFLAIASGLSVSNIYFAQPLLSSIAQDLNIQQKFIGLVITFSQIGYALGLFFIVPLGDLWQSKKLVVGQLILSTIALLLISSATTIQMLLLGMTCVGLMAVAAQVLVAYAANLSSNAQRGWIVGRITSGIVLGILLARFASGVLADWAGWRSIYIASAFIMILIAYILYTIMPTPTFKKPHFSYYQLLLSVWDILLNEPMLQIRAILAMLIFAAFSILWSAIALPLSAPPFLFTHTQIGLVALTGIIGAFAATFAGRWADKGYGQNMTGFALFLLVISWLLIIYLEKSIIILIIGIVLLDFAVQAVHVTSQTIILSTTNHTQSRVVSCYMIFYSLGSGLGAILSTSFYALWGWVAVCYLGITVSGLALLFWYLTRDY